MKRRPSPVFDDLFAELAGVAYRVAYRILGNRAAAEDVAQEALTRAYVRWSKIADYAAPWVVRVATNLALDLRRCVAPRDRPAEREEMGEREVDRRLELVAALQALPRRQREVVALRYLADLPEAEVAKALGCALGTVKSQSHRALAALRVALPGEETEGVRCV